MPVGSHKDAFKTHQLVKKLGSKEPNSVLAKLASSILLDFVKSMRQVNSDHVMELMPDDPTQYQEKRLDKALNAVGNLCGKCDDSHDDACFVNQARRVLIKAKTGVDIGSSFDGQKDIKDLLVEAEKLADKQIPAQPESMEESALQSGRPEMPDAISVTEAEFKKMQEENEALKEQSVFRGTLIEEIGATIARVSEGDFATEMEVHEDEQLGKLATAFNLMLATVNQTMANLDTLVAERGAEMKMVMDTVPTGILSIDEKFRINPDYSKVCEEILAMADLKGRDFFNVLGISKRRPQDRQKLEEFLDLLAQQILPEEDMAPLNPFKELELEVKKENATLPPTIVGERRERGRVHASTRWLQINYHLVHRGEGQPCHYLVLVEDITRAKEMAAEMVKAEKDNLQLKAIAEDPDLYCEFLEEGIKKVKTALHHTNQLHSAADSRPLVNEMFRGVHTIKGTAGAFNLDQIASQAAELENSLSDLRTADKIGFQTIESTEKGLTNLHNSFTEAVEKAQALLGREIGGDNSGDINLQVSANEIKRILTSMTTMDLDKKGLQKIIYDVRRLRAVPVKKGLARSLKIITGLGERLGKDITFDLVGGETKIDCEVVRELNTPMVHLFRNAFDHGIESPEKRLEADKPERGKVNLIIQEEKKEIRLIISDDGKGLDPEKLKKSALEKGVISQEEAEELSEQQCCALIFRAGFSTTESVSDVSGRGVGMDAALHTIRESLSGNIVIDSQPGKGSTFVITVPKEISCKL